MDTSLLLQNLLLGGLLGLLGQGIRLLAGLKKLSASPAGEDGTQFDSRRLLVSLLLGFLAGALGMITLLNEKGDIVLTKEKIIALIGFGYAGVDFIESILTKFVPKVVSGNIPLNLPNAANAAPLPAGPAANPQMPTYVQVIPRLPYSSK